MKFTCGIISDMALTLPANHIDSSGILYGNIYGTGKEDILPNGFSIPIIYCDQNHGNFAKDNTNYIDHPSSIQNVFRKTPLSVRADCMYHEFGDSHNANGSGIISIEDSLFRMPEVANVILRTEGMYYPDDRYNNMIFNHNLISLENEVIMQWVRFASSIGLYVSRFSLPDYQYSKETIKQLLPGTTTIAPYSLDDAGDYMLNAVIKESIKLPKIINTFDNNVYDFRYKLPNSFTTFVDTVDLFSINKPFTFSDVPEGYLQEIIVTGHNLVYDSSAHSVPNAVGFNFTSTYNFNGGSNDIPITFVPSADGANWNIQDVSGVKWFVSGTMETVINRDSNNRTVGENAAPGNSNIVTMKLKLPSNCTSGKISFDYKASSGDVAFVFLDAVKIYKNTTLLEQIIGNPSHPDLMSDLIHFTSPFITQDDEIIVSYSKTALVSMGFDVGFVNNIVVNATDPATIATVEVPAGTVPKLSVNLGSTVLVDAQSVVTLNQQLFTNVFIDKTIPEPLTFIYNDNICTSGYVSVYMKILSLPSVYGKAILDDN
jgi:hypothetical protein